MWHVRSQIAPAILLVVDFGGWYRLDSKSSNGSSSEMIHHTQVSLLKDVIVPYKHLLPRLHLSQNQKRHNLLYFKGAKHRHQGGVVREKLWDLLVNEAGVVMEEGFPNATGREQSIIGMRSSEFCLHPAGTPQHHADFLTPSKVFVYLSLSATTLSFHLKALLIIQNFLFFVAIRDALTPNWLLSHLKIFSKEQRDMFRRKMAKV